MKALNGVSLSIGGADFLGIIGPTGSGKSTLIQLMNALIRPNRGQVLVDNVDLASLKGPELREVRRKVGLVFQYPENQIFEETVAKEISFGPRNMGLQKEEIEARVKRAMGFVGLDFDDFKDRSPFALSGGQMRRVAIASVLAMEPEILILDEPTAGMDPQGRRDTLNRIAEVQRKMGMSVVLVSHNMEDVARFADRVMVMNEGQLVLSGSPREVFSHKELICRLGLEIPAMTQLMFRLGDCGANLRKDIFTEEDARDELLKHIEGAENA